MNTRQKKALYESIMKSVAKTVKNNLNEMAKHSDKSLLNGLTSAIEQYCKQNNINPNTADVKKALGNLSRKWSVNVNTSLKFKSNEEFQKFCEQKLLEILYGKFTGLTNEEKTAFEQFILHNVSWAEGYGYSDYEADRLSTSRCDSCADFDDNIDFSNFIETLYNTVDWDAYDNDPNYQIDPTYADKLYKLYDEYYDKDGYKNISILDMIYNNYTSYEITDDYCDTCIFEIFDNAGYCG